MGAFRTNIYINQHRDDVCGLIGATACVLHVVHSLYCRPMSNHNCNSLSASSVASSLSFIETSHIGFAAGNWIIDTTNDVTT